MFAKRSTKNEIEFLKSRSDGKTAGARLELLFRPQKNPD